MNSLIKRCISAGVIAGLLVFVLLDITGCSLNKKSAERNFFAMDTVMSITCYGSSCDAAADAAVAEIRRLEALLSVGDGASEVAKINGAGGGVLSEDGRFLIGKSLELYDVTGGAFDITVFPLMELWGFTSGDYAVPQEAELEEVLMLCGSDKLIYDAATGQVRLAEGQGIDFGGIAKGYASDRLAVIFEEYGLDAAYASLGGNVYCYHKKIDGTKWRIAVKNPIKTESDKFLGIVNVEDEAVVTSGGYERYFTDGTGQTYHHIIDPKTGYPAENGLISVTVVSRNGMLADGLSTACYVMGLDGSIELWRKYGEGEEAFELILMTDEGKVYVTQNIAGRFSSDYKTEIIRMKDK